MGVFGTHNYGKVDRIPGIGHVCTQFFHINFVPLFPVGTYFILEGVGDGDTGVQIPWSGKSIIVGWLRAALFVGALAVGLFGTIESLDQKGPPSVAGVAASIVAAAVLLAMFFGSYYVKGIGQASYDRCISLGQAVGFTDQTMLLIEVMHGRLTAEQADAELARRDELAAAQVVSAELVGE